MQRVSANMCYNNVSTRATLVARRSSSLSGIMRLPAGQFFTFAARRVTVHAAESEESFSSRQLVLKRDWLLTRKDATKRPALAQLRQSHLLISPADNPLSSRRAVLRPCTY